MPSPPKSMRSGVAWFLLILIPPLLVLAGLIAVFLWQGSKDGITPKWKKTPAPVTNSAPVSPAPAPAPVPAP